MLYWTYLALAILFEVIATLFLKYAASHQSWGYAAGTVMGYCFSFGLLALSLQKLPLSLSYAIWAGSGTALVAIASYFVFAEQMNALKVFCIFLIVAGVVGLKLLSK